MCQRRLHLYVSASGVPQTAPQGDKGDGIMVQKNQIQHLEVLTPIGKTSLPWVATILSLHYGCRSPKRRDIPLASINPSGPLMENDQHGGTRIDPEESTGKGSTSICQQIGCNTCETTPDDFIYQQTSTRTHVPITYPNVIGP